MGNSRQGQHQTVKAASSTNTASKQESAMLREEPQELLTNQALGRVLQAQRKLPQISSMPMDRIQRQSLHSSSGFRGLSQELARGGSQGLVVQPKLKLTKAGDRHEQQADRVAAQVVKRINTDPIRKAEPIDSKRIMPKAVAPTSAPTGTAVTPQFETTIQQQRGQGQAIPEDVREPLEEAFHADFRHVRIHTNEKSHQLSHSIQAIAFTTGTDIFFKQGAYQPRSRQGQELLAHELTHVVQQNSQKTAVQRKGAGQIQFSNEPFPEIATFVQDVTQEIQSFSDTWLNSPPSEIEIFPWFKLVKPSIKLEQTTDNCSLDIQGELKLNFGSDFGAIQPKGGFKINYQSQTKKWDYKSENVGVEVTVSEILQFKANNIQYDRASKALKIENADLTIPKLNDIEATVTDATIGQAGLDWKTATISATEISLGSYAKITNPRAIIGGPTAKYNSSFTGGFNVNLGQPDLASLNGSGELTVTYQDEKWGCTQKDVQLKGTIANILNFAASGIAYNHDEKEFSIATASVSIPKLNNATATVTETKINSDGLTWNKATLNAENIALGEYAKVTKVEASVDGKSKPYTIAIAKLGITIPKLNNTAATVTDATIGQAGLDWKTATISATEISLGSYAKITNPRAIIGGPTAKYNSSFTGGFNVNLGQPDLASLNGSGELTVTYQDEKWGCTQKDVQLKGTIANILNFAASGIAYNHDEKEFSIATASVSIPKLNNATATVTETKINSDGLTWNKATLNAENIALGEYAKVTKVEASVDGKSKPYTIAIAKLGITIPKLNNTAATVTDATIGQAGLDWKTATISATEISLGSYAKITNPRAIIGGPTAKYNSSFTGGFNVNLGQPDLASLNGSGELTVTYQDEKWGCTQKDVQLKGTIANILNFAASGIAYNHDEKEFSIATASVSIPKLNNATATVTETKINSDGLTWNKATLNAENIALGEYAKVTKVEASVDGKSKPYTIAIAKLGITIPKLNNTAATVTDATIGQAGLDWKTATISATEISLGSYAKITNPRAIIGGPTAKYNSSFTGGFNVNLGQPDLASLNGSGELTVTYQDEKWGCTQKDVQLKGTIANILNFAASGIAYNHDEKEFSIATASVSIPKLNNATATVTETKINSDGLTWNKATLNAENIALGEYAKVTKVEASVDGKSKPYTIAIAKLGITIPKLNNTAATVTDATIGQAGLDWKTATISATEISLGSYAKITNPRAIIGGPTAKYNSSFTGGFNVNLGQPDLASLNGSGELTVTYQDEKWGCTQKDVQLKGTIANILNFAASGIAYNHDEKEFSIATASVSIPKLNNATATVTETKINSDGLTWNKATLNAENIALGEYAKVTKVEASVDGKSKPYTIAIAKLGITIPKLNNTAATVTDATIGQAGLDWKTATISATEISLGSYAKITNPRAIIGGPTAKYNSSFTGGFNVNLGQPDLASLNGSGELTVTYQDEKWGCTQKDVQLKGTIANILNFAASGIAYNHDEKEFSIATASVSIPKLNNATATVTETKINSDGLTWNKATLNAENIALGEYAKVTKVEASVDGKSKPYTIAIAKLGITIPKLNNTAATVTDATIGQAGLDWKTATISATEISLGSYAKITNPRAIIGGPTAKYNSSFTGGFNVNLGQPDLASLNGSGELTVTYQDEKWGCTQKDVQLKGTIANILNFAASGIAYNHDEKEFSIATASVSIPKLNNATATVTETKINSDGLTWNKATLNAENIALGDYAKITKVEASVDGKSKPYTIAIAKLGITIPKLNNTAATVTDATIGQAGLDWKTATISATEISLGSYVKITNPRAIIGGPTAKYNSSFTGGFNVNLGQPDLLQINGSGNLSVTYQDEKWGCTQKDVQLKGTIANILNFAASGIAYNHDNKEFSIATASVSIPKLNNATAEVKKTKINEDGLDWDTVTVQIDDISLGDVLSIKQPAFTVEGKDSGYSTTASGGIGLHFGEYLNAEGSGKIKLDRSKGNGEGKILVEHANLTAKGGIKLPGESFPWPNIDINYPIVPGVEAGIGLSIKGGIGASLQGSIAKEASKDWNLGVNPEINGFLEVVLKAKIAAGSAYFAAIQAFVEGGCKANFSGGLQLNGSLKYDEETKKVDASQLTSKYYANADFKASISAGVQAQALYFFTKDLYRIRATCSLGAGRLEGNLEFDQDGKFHIGKPNFSGVIAGEFDRNSIKLEEKSYVLIASENADAILKEAAIKIAGSGEKRKDIINAVKAGFIRSLNETKEVINQETAKSQKYIEKLEKTNMKLSRYHELIEIAKQTEEIEDSFNSQNIDLDKKLEEEDAALNAQEATEAEIVDEVKVNKEVSKDNNGIFSKAKKAVKKGIETVENTKQKIKKIIPEKLVKKYKELKKQSADRIQRERNAIRIKYTDFKEEKKKSFSSLKESFPKITDKVSEIKSEASDLKKKASAWKTRTKESIKEKTLVKLTELGIKDSQSFVKRIEKLTELQIKYSEKHELHSNFLKSAIEAKGKSKIVLKDVEAAIANLQQLEDGTGMNKLTEMTEQEKVLKNVQEDLSKDEVKLDDDLMKQLAKIEMEEAEA